jgi:hypothetical protein
MTFKRLIRFENENGEVVYGNLEKETPTKEIEGSVVEVIDGSIEKGFSKTSQKATVKKASYLLSIPFQSTDSKPAAVPPSLRPPCSTSLHPCCLLNWHLPI